MIEERRIKQIISEEIHKRIGYEEEVENECKEVINSILSLISSDKYFRSINNKNNSKDDIRKVAFEIFNNELPKLVYDGDIEKYVMLTNCPNLIRKYIDKIIF